MTTDSATPPTGHSGRWIPAIGVVLVVGIALLVPIRYPGRLLGIVFDFAHVPVFAVLVCVVIRLVCGREPGWKAAISIALTAAFFGLAGEYLQRYVGRSGGWADAASNAIGAAIGFTVATSSRWRRVPLLVWSAVLLIALVMVFYRPVRILTDIARQRNEFPMLGSFENELELSRWSTRWGRLSRSSEHAVDGEYSLRWEMEPGEYPRCTLQWPSNDWTSYGRLEFDIWNDSDQPIEMTTKVEDFHHNFQHNDRFQQVVYLAAGRTRVQIDLNAVRTAPRGREMDMALISRVSLFTIDLQQPRVLYVDRMRLVK